MQAGIPAKPAMNRPKRRDFNPEPEAAHKAREPGQERQAATLPERAEEEKRRAVPGLGEA